MVKTLFNQVIVRRGFTLFFKRAKIIKLEFLTFYGLHKVINVNKNKHEFKSRTRYPLEKCNLRLKKLYGIIKVIKGTKD